MAFDQLLGLAGTGWQGRVQEGAYTSPSGTRIVFSFVEVSRSTTKRTEKFQFNGLDGTYVQENGISGRDYPLVCFLTGETHDLEATALEEAALEPGRGRLQHPLYGTFDVIPTGVVSRRNDLVQGANQSVVEITFSTTLAQLYPAPFGLPVNEVSAALQGFSVAAAQQFDDVAALQSKLDEATGKATIRKVLAAVKSSLRAVSDQTAAAKRDFDSRSRAINDGLDTLVGQPLLLAQQVIGLILAPSRALAGLENRLEGYATFAESLFGLNASTPTLSGARRRAINDLHITDLSATSAVAGAVSSIVETQFTARPQALRAVTDLAAQMDALVTWRESRFGELDEIDPGGSYQALQEAVALASGYLVELSFTLLPERRRVLVEDQTAIELCAELYGSLTDERLQFFIDTNRLTGSEILEIPKGREVVWYA